MSGPTPLRSIAEPTKEEYKALRDEILNLFTRIFVLLSIVIGAGATVFARLWTLDPLTSERLFSLWAVVIMVLVAEAATLKFYDHIARVGTYLEVVHELKGAGWHEVNRGILRFADSEPGRKAIDALLAESPDTSWRARRWVRLLARWNERNYVVFAYVMLGALTAAGLWAERERCFTDLLFPLLLVFWWVSLVLPWFIPTDQNRYWAVVWRARLSASGIEKPPAEPQAGTQVPEAPHLELRWGSLSLIWGRSNASRRCASAALENNQMQRTAPGDAVRRR